jgi:hypothetical protein
MCQSVSCEGLKCTCWVFEALEYRHRVKKFTGGGVGGGHGPYRRVFLPLGTAWFTAVTAPTAGYGNGTQR